MDKPIDLSEIARDDNELNKMMDDEGDSNEIVFVDLRALERSTKD